MIRFPSDCRTMTSPSHSRKLLKFFFYISGEVRRGWSRTPHLLHCVGFPRFGGRGWGRMIHHRWLQCGDSGLVRVRGRVSSSRVSRRVPSLPESCAACDSRTSQSPRPLPPPPRRSPRPAADQFNVSTEIADDRYSCRSSSPC